MKDEGETMKKRYKKYQRKRKEDEGIRKENFRKSKEKKEVSEKRGEKTHKIFKITKGVDFAFKAYKIKKKCYINIY